MRKNRTPINSSLNQTPQHKRKTNSSPAQRDPQGVLTKDDENSYEAIKEKLTSQTQDFKYAQSSKFSKVARTLIFGILGTVWAFSLNGSGLSFKRPWLMSALLLCLVYLLCDVFHYYLDSIGYNNELYELDNYKTEEDLAKHEEVMNKINKRSNGFITLKFILLILTSAVFCVGIIML